MMFDGMTDPKANANKVKSGQISQWPNDEQAD
jgi:hypothetical protein